MADDRSWEHFSGAHRLVAACKKGDLLAVQILTTLGKLSKGVLVEGARTACGSGHVELMECFCNCMDMQPLKQVLLISACNSRHEDMVRWVVQRLQPALQHRSAFEEDAFTVACSHMGLGLAKWLWARGGVDIHFADDSAFKGACANGRFDTARWLLGLHPDWAAWPAHSVASLKTWSGPRHTWIRAVTVSP